MSEIDEFLAHAQELQERYAGLRLSEADTRSYMIDPVLRLLGYSGVDHLRREVPVASTKEFLDYQLLVRGEPRAIVEAKPLRQAVSDQHAGQCVQYAAVLGVRWCFITNGIEWLLYDAYAKGPLADKRVASVRLDGDTESLVDAWKVLSLFSRGALERADPINSLLVERVLMDELGSADSTTVAAIRRAVQRRFGERVSAATVVGIADGLFQRAAVRAAVEVASTPLPASPIPTKSAERPPREPRRRAGGRRVSLADLIAAGLLPDGAAIEALVSGVSHPARVVGGSIELNGSTYDSPSAASMALRNANSWNGWIDWRYRGDTLAMLRSRLESAGAGPSEVQSSSASEQG